MAAKILVLEDYWDSRAILKMLPQNLWETVIEAKNVHEGLGKAAAELPDLIIMDIGLPVMEGIETTLKLKQNPATAEISVDAYTIWKEQAQQAGIVEYPTKPTPQPVFKDVLERHWKSGVKKTLFFEKQAGLKIPSKGRLPRPCQE